MMNKMNLDQIAKNLNLNDECLREMLQACGIEAHENAVTLTETMQLMQYAKEHRDDRERKSCEYLAMACSRSSIFIDTCELLHEQFPTLLEHLTPLLRQNEKKLMIPSGVENELKALFFKNEELRERIGGVMELLEKKEQEGLVAVCGREGETFADQQMLSIATGALLSDTTLIITRDNALSEDVLKLNQLASVQGKRVVVNRINRYGYLSRYIPRAEREAAVTAA